MNFAERRDKSILVTGRARQSKAYGGSSELTSMAKTRTRFCNPDILDDFRVYVDILVCGFVAQQVTQQHLPMLL